MFNRDALAKTIDRINDEVTNHNTRGGWGRIMMDREKVLAAFADGTYVEPMFGPDRTIVAQTIAAYLQGIIPTDRELAENTYGDGGSRRIAAYRRGRDYMVSTYYEYPESHALPNA